MPNPADPFAISGPATTRTAIHWAAGFAVVYAAAQALGFSLRTGSEERLISVIWPAAGVLPAVLVLATPRLWPVLLLVAAGVECTAGLVFDGTTFGRGRGTVMAAVIGSNLTAGLTLALAVRCFVGHPDPLSGGWRFVRYVLACAAAAAVNAAIATPVLARFSVDPFSFAGAQKFWLSSVSGCLMAATPILVAAAGRPSWPARARCIEGMLLFLTTAGLAAVLGSAPAGVSRVDDFGEVMLLPLLAWAMLRFGSAMLATLASSIVVLVMLSMVQGRGTFVVAALSMDENVLAAQGHIVPGMLAVLGVAAVYEGRRAADGRLREAEHQLRKAEKMNALTTMAKGVAGDFGNLAVAVRAARTTVQRGLGQPSAPVRRALQQLDAAANQAELLTRSLEAVGTQHPRLDPVPINVVHALTGVRDMFAPLLEARRRFSVHLPPRPTFVAAQPGDLQQILSNLIVNARDATADGGRISIRLESLDDVVALHVRDDGEGMPADVVDRMFDPFYTTKPRGKGTGLGLATVASLTRDRGGEIDVTSTPGVGTRITIRLPRVGADGMPADPSPEDRP